MGERLLATYPREEVLRHAGDDQHIARGAAPARRAGGGPRLLVPRSC